MILDDGQGGLGFTREAQVEQLQVRQAGQVSTAWINAGIALMDPQVFDLFDPERCACFEGEVYPKLIQLGRLGHKHLRGAWHCIDTLEDLEQANLRETKKGQEVLAA